MSRLNLGNLYFNISANSSSFDDTLNRTERRAGLWAASIASALAIVSIKAVQAFVSMDDALTRSLARFENIDKDITGNLVKGIKEVTKSLDSLVTPILNAPIIIPPNIPNIPGPNVSPPNMPNIPNIPGPNIGDPNVPNMSNLQLPIPKISVKTISKDLLKQFTNIGRDAISIGSSVGSDLASAGNAIGKGLGSLIPAFLSDKIVSEVGSITTTLKNELPKIGKVATGIVADMTDQMNSLGDVDILAEYKKRMARQARMLSIKSLSTPIELSQAFTPAFKGKMGFDEATQALPIAERFAVVNTMDVTKAMEALVQMQLSLQMTSNTTAGSMAQLARISTVVSKGVAFSTVSVEELSKALEMKGATAAVRMGMSLEEVTSSMIALSEAGIKGQQAGQVFETFARQVDLAASRNTNIWNSLGLQPFDPVTHKLMNIIDLVQILKSRFDSLGDNDEGMLKMTTTLGMNQKTLGNFFQAMSLQGGFGKYTKSLQGGNTATFDTRMYDKILGSFSSQWQKFKNTIAVVGIEIGEILAPVLMRVVQSIKSFMNAWIDLDEPIKQVIVTIAGVFGGLVLAGFGFRLLTEIIYYIGYSFRALLIPIYLVGSAFSVLGNVISLVFSGIYSSILVFTKIIQGIFSIVYPVIIGLIAAFKYMAIGIGIAISGTFSFIYNFVKVIVNSFAYIPAIIVGAFKSIFYGIDLIFAGIRSIIMMGFGLILIVVGSFIYAIASIPIVFNTIISSINSVLHFLNTTSFAIEAIIVGVFSGIVASVKILASVIGNTLVSIYKVMLSLGTSIASSIGSVLTSAVAGAITFIIGLTSAILTLGVTIAILLPAIAAIAAIGATIGIGIGQGFVLLGAGLMSVWEGIKSGWENTSKAITGGMKQIGEVGSNMWDRAKEGTKSFFEGTKNFIRNTIDFLYNFQENIGVIMDWIGLHWESIIQDMGAAVISLLGNIRNNLLEFSSTILEVGGNSFKLFANLIYTYMGPVFGWFRDNWKNILDDMGTLFKSFLSAIFQNFKIILPAMGKALWEASVGETAMAKNDRLWANSIDIANVRNPPENDDKVIGNKAARESALNNARAIYGPTYTKLQEEEKNYMKNLLGQMKGPFDDLNIKDLKTNPGKFPKEIKESNAAAIALLSVAGTSITNSFGMMYSKFKSRLEGFKPVTPSFPVDQLKFDTPRYIIPEQAVAAVTMPAIGAFGGGLAPGLGGAALAMGSSKDMLTTIKDYLKKQGLFTTPEIGKEAGPMGGAVKGTGEFKEVSLRRFLLDNGAVQESKVQQVEDKKLIKAIEDFRKAGVEMTKPGPTVIGP